MINEQENSEFLEAVLAFGFIALFLIVAIYGG